MTPALCLAAALVLLQSPVEPPASPPASGGDMEQAAARALSRVTLKDGRELYGVVVRRDERHVVLELPRGGQVALAVDEVERVEEAPRVTLRADGQIWREAPKRSQYLYGPSGMMLRRGQLSLSQTELVLSTLQYGVSDHVTLQAGTALPLWPFTGGSNLIVGIKVGGSLGERFHLASGVQLAVLPVFSSSPSLGALLMGTATYGTPDAHVSLGMLLPVMGTSYGRPIAGDFLFTLSGNLRLSRHVALVTENWMLPAEIPSHPTFPMVNSLAVRLMGERLAVDIGGMLLPFRYRPYTLVPWLDFTYTFG